MKHNTIKSAVCMAVLTFFSALTPVSVLGQESMKLPDLMQAFGWDFDSTEIKAEKVSDDLYVLFGIGGNIAVSVGEQGVLLVDDQFPQMMDKIKAAVKALGGNGIDFVVNTHWHFDHAEGNLALGPKGVWLVSQANSREMMKSSHTINLVHFAYDQQTYPKAALPIITFDDHMQFHFNGQRIDLMHYGAAHTTGDAAVVFRGTNAVHMGDVYNNGGYPFIDADNGGDVDGVVRFCQGVLESIDENTVVISGHGPISDYQGLKAYISMVSQVRDRIAKLIDEGASLAEVKAATPTAEWDAKQGDPMMFIDRAYTSLKKHR